MLSIKKILIFAVLFGFVPSIVVAKQLPRPTGEVVLTLSGELQNTNTADGQLELDLDMLMALPKAGFKTSTIWTDEPIKFSGVLMRDILDFAGARGTVVHAIALNDYKVDIPAKSAKAEGPLVAYHMNGETMSARDKGPLWVVYPYDYGVEYRTEVIYSRSIWQLDRLTMVQ